MSYLDIKYSLSKENYTKIIIIVTRSVSVYFKNLILNFYLKMNLDEFRSQELEIDKIFFSLKHGIYNKETLDLYEKYRQTLPISFKKDTSLYALYKCINIDQFILKISNCNFFELKKIVNIEENIDFRFDKILLVQYKVEDDQLAIQIEQGYNTFIFFRKVIIEKYHILHNYTFVEISFGEMTEPKIEKLIEGDLVQDFSTPRIFFCKNSLIFDKIILINDTFLQNYRISIEDKNFVNRNKYKLSSGILSGDIETCELTKEQVDKIISLTNINYNTISNYNDKIEISMMTNYEMYQKIKDICNYKTDLKLFDKESFASTELNAWAQKNTRDAYFCCDSAFDYSGGASWLVFAITLRERKITPYHENLYNIFKRLYNIIDPVPVGTYMFRGLKLPKNGEIKNEEKCFSSYSSNLKTPITFSGSFSGSHVSTVSKSIILFHKVKENENIKSFFISGKYSAKIETKGLGEFVLQDNMKSNIQHSFDFGDTSFYEITSFEKIDDKEPEVDYDFEKYYNIEEIVKNKECFYIQYDEEKRFFYFVDIFTDNEISRLKKYDDDVEFIEINCKDKYFPFYDDIYRDLTYKIVVNNLFLRIPNNRLKDFIQKINIRKIPKFQDFF